MINKAGISFITPQYEEETVTGIKTC